jgi:hypothetical protein
MKKKLLIIWNYLMEIQESCNEIEKRKMFGKF